MVTTLDELLVKLEALAEKATPGPWTYDGTFSDSATVQTKDADILQMESWPLGDLEDEQQANLDLILTLRNALPTIIEALKAADALEAAARENERLVAENQAASRNVYRLQADGVQFCEALAEIADASWPGPDAVDRIRALAKRSLGRTT